MAQNAPEAAVAPEAAGTPQEQPATAPVDQAPDQRQPPTSEPERITPAEFTKRSQEMAAIRRELGLPPKASGEEILAALAGLRKKAQGVVVDDEIIDPKIASRIADADERLWKSLNYVHGDTASRAREFAEFARTTRDPEELVEKFYELMPRDGSTPPMVAAAQEGTAAPAAPVPPSAVGLADSDTRPSGASNEASASEEFRNTGNVEGFLRRLNLFGGGEQRG